jgi:hypothetical protein
MAQGKTRTASKPRTRSRDKAAPDQPVEVVNEHDQQLLMQAVEPASGYALVRLVSPEDRERIGFSKDSKAFQSSALVQALRLHPSDEGSPAGMAAGDLLFVSLEEIAPLLGTRLFLVPFTRMQGRIPTAQDEAPVKRAFGFGL